MKLKLIHNNLTEIMHYKFYTETHNNILFGIGNSSLYENTAFQLYDSLKIMLFNNIYLRICEQLMFKLIVLDNK